MLSRIFSIFSKVWQSETAAFHRFQELPKELQVLTLANLEDPIEVANFARVSIDCQEVSNVTSLWKPFGANSRNQFIGKQLLFFEKQMLAAACIFDKMEHRNDISICILGDIDAGKNMNFNISPNKYSIMSRYCREVILNIHLMTSNTPASRETVAENLRSADVALVFITDINDTRELREIVSNQEKNTLLLYVITENQAQLHKKKLKNAVVIDPNDTLYYFFRKVMNKVDEYIELSKSFQLSNQTNMQLK